MLRRLTIPLVAIALVAPVATVAGAQVPEPSVARACRAGSTQLEDACQKATDLFAFLVPQVGAALAGGSAMPGDDAAVGARRLNVVTRVTTVMADLPSIAVEMPAAGAAQRTTYVTTRLPLPAPALDLALGLGSERRLGGLRLPGVEILANVAYVPALAATTVQVTPTASAWRVGFGARVGLVAEGPRVPGISVSWQERGLPALDIAATSLASDDTLAVRGFGVRTRAWRITAQRTRERTTNWISVGGDHYTASGRLAPIVREDGRRYPSEDSPADGYLMLLAQSARRANASAGMSLGLGPARFVAEGGFASGGRIATYNVFAGRRADDLRWFGSVGVRVD